MTALCGGGSSQPRPLTQPIINMSGVAASGLATAFGFPELSIVVGLAAGGLDIVTAALCSTDPPPDPGIVQQDVFDALNLNSPEIAIPAQNKIQQWFMHRYWWDICQCSSTSTPAPPVMSNPGTGVGIGTGAPSGVNAGPCFSQYGAAHFQNSTGGGPAIVEPWLPSGPGSLHSFPASPLVPWCLLPPTMTGFSWDLQLVSTSRPSLLYFVPADTSGTSESLPPIADSGVPSSWKGSSPWTPTAAQPYANFETTSNPSSPNPYTADWVGTVSITCSGQGPSSIVQPCCPPDPLLEIKLDRLLGLVLELRARTPGTIGNYVKGTRHAGLTGSGNIAVSNRNGVLVDVTTAPPTFVQGGNPPYVWDLGWLSCSTADGFIDEKRLTRTVQIWLPSLFPISNSFGYFLNPGVVADITELLPA